MRIDVLRNIELPPEQEREFAKAEKEAQKALRQECVICGPLCHRMPYSQALALGPATSLEVAGGRMSSTPGVVSGAMHCPRDRFVCQLWDEKAEKCKDVVLIEAQIAAAKKGG